MKGAVSTIAIIAVAAVLVAAVGYGYYNSPEKSLSATGRAVTSKSTTDSRLGYQDPCNPNRDRCNVGLVCKFASDNIYRCLQIS